MPSTLRLMLMTLSVILFSFVGFTANAQTEGGTSSPTLTSDKADYAPGEKVTLTGTGFGPNEEIDLVVEHVGSDPLGTDPQYHDHFHATTDAAGNFVAYWDVPIDGDALGASFVASAKGVSSGLYAEAYFTDKANTALVLSSPASAEQNTIITITATLTDGPSGPAVSGKTITFTLNGSSIGSGTTNASGVVSINYTVTAAVGTYNGVNGIRATFAGDGSYNGSFTQANFEVLAPACSTPSISTSNSCIGGSSITFSQTGGTSGGTWSVNGGGTINSSTGEFTPTTAGSYNVTYSVGTCSDTKSFIVFPSSPTITAPVNTCASAFTLPSVASVTGFTVQYSIDGGAYAAAADLTVPSTTGSHTVKARYVFTSGSVAAPTACAESNEVSTIIYALPVITLSANNGATQYSDAAPALSIGVTDSDGPGVLSVSTSYVTPTNNTPTSGLPSGLSIIWSGSGLTKAGTLTGTALANAGVYTITITATDGFCSSSTVYVLTINKETVCSDYNGNLSVSAVTLKNGGNKATITMSVGLDENDGTGNITNATVKFKLVEFTLPGADANGWVTVPVKSLNYPLNTQGNASLIADVTFSGTPYASYTFEYQVSGNYISNCGDNGSSVINVYVPQNEFITGGGYVRPNSSVGVFSAETGRKANFGFNVKYNNKMTNLQGNINYIFRRMEADNIVHVYQVKGNAMTSLVVNGGTSPKTATFIGKCNVADVTITDNPNFVNYLSIYGGTGNSTMQIEVSDAGEPGTSDQYVITVWNSKGDVFHSSNWISTKAVKQTLSGGNIQVGSVVSTTTKIDNTLTRANQDHILLPLTVKALPNPTSAYFNVQIQSDNVKDPVQLKVYDLFGRQIEVKNNVAPNSSVQLGGNYIPGVYMVDIIQGDKRQQLKLVKQ